MKGKDEVMRSSGVLMHISSLPSPYGIGTMGKEARKFADFLEKSGQKYWQILPICPTSYGDSPYQSFSSFAGNPYFIDLEYLCKEKLLKKAECESFPWGKKADKVDYGVMYESRYKLLKIAFERFLRAEPDDFEAFCEKEADWLSDYALFMALKDANGGNAWFSWEKDLKMRKPEALAEARSTYAKDIRFYQMLQYLFFKQWWELKAYVNEKGIEIIGDVPIYVAGDSADVWANPEEFYLDEDLNPIDVAGCPPDAFSEDGQLWGNPLFRWDVMKKNGYTWWTKRIAAMSKLYDIVRIDHFRGFDSYYAIPAKDKTAKNGEWRKGPGRHLTKVIRKATKGSDIIAEDLGIVSDKVRALINETGWPGMKILEFAFDGDASNEYLPHQYKNTNCLVYGGTHDNQTLLGYYGNKSDKELKFMMNYLHIKRVSQIPKAMLRAAYASIADTVIFQMQDILELDDTARMNEPSTVGTNWRWRMQPGAFDGKKIKMLRKMCKLYAR